MPGAENYEKPRPDGAAPKIPDASPVDGIIPADISTSLDDIRSLIATLAIGGNHQELVWQDRANCKKRTLTYSSQYQRLERLRLKQSVGNVMLHKSV